MQIWLLENGEKSEPQESFQIRERISSGELTGDTLAWYKGAEEWVRLDEVPQFESLFIEEVEEEDVTQPPPLPDLTESIKEAIEYEASKAPPLHLFRRFFARMFDSLIYAFAVMAVFRERILDAAESGSVWTFLAVGLTYVVLDGVMTHAWKFSPGKFLLGMRITDHAGFAIPLKAAVIRSLRVWVVGLGMWQLWFISMPISWLLSRKLGYFLWDIPYRNRVMARPLSPFHVSSYVLALVICYALFLAVMPLEFFEDFITRFGTPEQIQQWQEVMKNMK